MQLEPNCTITMIDEHSPQSAGSCCLHSAETRSQSRVEELPSNKQICLLPGRSLPLLHLTVDSVYCEDTCSLELAPEFSGF